MKEITVFCDECKKTGSAWIKVSNQSGFYDKHDKGELDFCDRLCLIRFFEKNPNIFNPVNP